MSRTVCYFVLVFLSIGWVVAGASALAQKATSPPKLKREPIKPLPLELDLDQRKVELGRELFHDVRLSKDNTVSCASCHDLSAGGVDGLESSIGIYNKRGSINAPTVLNSAFNFRQFWDGRAASLEEQVEGPIHNPIEMGSNWDEVVLKLSESAPYAEMFEAIYDNGIHPANIADAISEFERSLVTPNAPFDQYLRGDDSALTEKEQRGYRKFKGFGCTACHQGVNVGGNMYETLGAMADYFAARGNITEADFGRFNVTGREEDRFVFKVPSLRNVALTAPYFHDGSAKSLPDAVAVMAEFQLGIWLSDDDIDDIVAFLLTLTGES